MDLNIMIEKTMNIELKLKFMFFFHTKKKQKNQNKLRIKSEILFLKFELNITNTKKFVKHLKTTMKEANHIK